LAPTAATQRVVRLNDDGLDHPSPFTPLSPPSRTTTASSSVALAPADMMSSELHYELHDWSDARITDLVARMSKYAQTLPMRWPAEVSNPSRRQRSPPEPDLRASPRGWGVEREDPSSMKEITPRPRKRKRPVEDETGDRTATQRGETQELSVRRTPGRKLMESKLGHRAPRMEALVVPPQGISPTRSLGPVVTRATPGSPERDEAWTEGRRGIIEDPHDENETDEERWERLMKCEGGVWKCMGCGEIQFSDRSTLQRHCKSLVHGKERDLRKCPHCEKKFARCSGVNRHVKQKHPELATE